MNPAVAPRTLQQQTSKPELGRDTVVLYFGNDWFAENRTSSHHLARQLARKFRVYYIECPGWRAPRGSSRDLKKIVTKLYRFLRGTSTVEGGIRLRTLVQIPFHRFALVRWLNRCLVRATLGWLLWREGVRHSISWFHIPHVPFLVGNLGEVLSVYYCTDDYSAYPGVNAAVVRAMDDETTRQADLVFVTSDTLLEAKSRLNTQISVSPHGVEFEHFARSQDPRLPVPNDIAQFRGPVVGFFGLIERFIDLELIDWIAEQRPQWQFVFVGRVAVPAESLPCRANVHFLGKRPYESLPGYAKRFDACIIPYRAGDWSYHANPLKLREYLAAGKPVVAVSTPQTEKFADVVETARTREEFLAGLDRMLERPPTPTETTCRMAKVADASWAARAEVVVRELRTALAVDTSVSLAGS